MFPREDPPRLAHRVITVRLAGLLADLLADLRSAAAARSLVSFGDDAGSHDAGNDWEVDEHERSGEEQGTRERVSREAGSGGRGARGGRRTRKRAGQPPCAPQPCLCPIRREEPAQGCWRRPHATYRSRGASCAPRLRCARD